MPVQFHIARQTFPFVYSLIQEKFYCYLSPFRRYRKLVCRFSKKLNLTKSKNQTSSNFSNHLVIIYMPFLFSYHVIKTFKNVKTQMTGPVLRYIFLTGFCNV